MKILLSLMKTPHPRAESSLVDFVCVHPSFPAANLADVPVYPHCVLDRDTLRICQSDSIFYGNYAVCLTGLQVTEGCLSGFGPLDCNISFSAQLLVVSIFFPYLYG